MCRQTCLKDNVCESDVKNEGDVSYGDIVVAVQEIAKKELDNLFERRNNLENEVLELEQESVSLQQLYTKQDEVLAK